MKSSPSKSLRQAIFEFGFLDRIDGAKHRQQSVGIELALAGDGPIPSKEETFPFYLTQVQAQGRIIDQLKAGVLLAAGLVRGDDPSKGRVSIHRDRWHLLKPDFANSSASSPGLVLDGIVVFPAAGFSDSAAAPLGAQAKRWIAEHLEELLPLSGRKQAARVADAIGCKLTTARNALHEEKLPGGQLHVHK